MTIILYVFAIILFIPSKNKSINSKWQPFIYSLLYVIVERKIKKFIFLTLYYEYVYNSCTNDVIMCNSIQQVVTTEFTKINLLK